MLRTSLVHGGILGGGRVARVKVAGGPACSSRKVVAIAVGRHTVRFVSECFLEGLKRLTNFES